MLGSEPIAIFGREQGETPSGGKRGREFGSLVGVFIFLPQLAIVAGLQLPVLLVAVPWQRWKHRHFVERMKAQNRVMAWSDFIRCAEEKRGTLIIEGERFKGATGWWTDENVRAVSPHCFSESTLGKVGRKQRGYIPFRTWCYERYTNPASGHAFLVVEEGESKLHFLEKQPDTAVIVALRPSRCTRKAKTTSL